MDPRGRIAGAGLPSGSPGKADVSQPGKLHGHCRHAPVPTSSHTSGPLALGRFIPGHDDGAGVTCGQGWNRCHGLHLAVACRSGRTGKIPEPTLIRRLRNQGPRGNSRSFGTKSRGTFDVPELQLINLQSAYPQFRAAAAATRHGAPTGRPSAGRRAALSLASRWPAAPAACRCHRGADDQAARPARRAGSSIAHLAMPWPPEQGSRAPPSRR
jgi:hypothetical protein